jgi:nucleoside-diphosphate-sugar epimerase
MIEFKNLPVLITGGAGFIGSHLADKLIEFGARVTILDNLSTGSIDNLKTIIQKINFINGNINDLQTCLKATHNQKIVFHLAAFVSVTESMQNPEKCNGTNINGTLNLLEACRINKVDKFIFSSSSAVYGNKNGMCIETDNCNPTSVYGYSKYIGEILCKQYWQLFGLKTICLRYFNVYGERQNPNGVYAAVVAKFNHCMKNNLPISIYGDGQQTRDFIHVDNVVEANIKLSMLSNNFNCYGESINIASGKSITLIELINNLKINFPNYNLDPIFLLERKGDVKISEANCKKYEQIFKL